MFVTRVSRNWFSSFKEETHERPERSAIFKNVSSVESQWKFPLQRVPVVCVRNHAITVRLTSTSSVFRPKIAMFSRFQVYSDIIQDTFVTSQ